VYASDGVWCGPDRVCRFYVDGGRITHADEVPA
jgi:hypothetical protein